MKTLSATPRRWPPEPAGCNAGRWPSALPPPQTSFARTGSGHAAPTARRRVPPAERIEHDGVHGVEEQVVVGEVVHAPIVPRIVAGVPLICGGNVQKQKPRRGAGASVACRRLSLTRACDGAALPADQSSRY